MRIFRKGTVCPAHNPTGIKHLTEVKNWNQLPIEVYLVSDLGTNCLTMESINQKIADESLGNLILNAINTIRKNEKRPDASSIYEFVYKELKSRDINIEIIKKILSSLTNKNKIENKLMLDKTNTILEDRVISLEENNICITHRDHGYEVFHK